MSVSREAVPTPVPLSERPFTAHDALLYALTVLAWSASWYALKVNAACEVSPPVAIAWRFVLTAAIVFAWVARAGGPVVLAQAPTAERDARGGLRSRT